MNLKFNSLFIYSEKNAKFFFTEFGDGLNVVHGRNTSGKSTFIQLILFAMGINEDRIRLASILSEDIYVRLDCEIRNKNVMERTVFIRRDDVIFIRRNDKQVFRFTGIGGNNSAEHSKLKDFIRELFEFKLMVENKSGLNNAPIETIFLPYYVAQSVGWVYLRKSFSNLDFYRNFKEDFLDYYLGIESYFDRIRKQQLEKQLLSINDEISFLQKMDVSQDDIQVARLTDDQHSNRASSYLEKYVSKQKHLIKLDTEYVDKCNELTFYNQRVSVVSKVDRNQKHQMPGSDHCPVCTQTLPRSIETIYNYFQAENDSIAVLKDFKEKSKKIQSDVNSLQKRIKELRDEIADEYNIYKSYETQNVTAETWITNKVNLRLGETITTRLGNLVQEQFQVKEELNKFKTDVDIKNARQAKSYVFLNLFNNNMADMKLPQIEEDQFNDLYNISSFPFQGVELLQTVMCYHFAFNSLISETPNIHRFPFILDGIFKEDVEGVTRGNILEFVNKHRPSDTQTIVSIANAKEADKNPDVYNKQYFSGKGTLICIGEGKDQRAILRPYNKKHEDLILDSNSIMEQV